MAGSKNGSMNPRWGVGLVVLALIVVFGSDGVRTGLVKSGVADDATQIAHDAADNYHSFQNVDTAYASAQAEAATKGDTITSPDNFSVTNTGTVTVVLTKVNHTLVLDRLNASWKSFSATASSTWAP